VPGLSLRAAVVDPPDLVPSALDPWGLARSALVGRVGQADQGGQADPVAQADRADRLARDLAGLEGRAVRDDQVRVVDELGDSQGARAARGEIRRESPEPAGGSNGPAAGNRRFAM
jgi:hypothetical protein